MKMLLSRAHSAAICLQLRGISLCSRCNASSIVCQLGQGINPPSPSSPQEQLLSEHNIVTIQKPDPIQTRDVASLTNKAVS